MAIYFTSDTHFGEQRALELSKRPFETTDEMDNAIIENWNKVVAPEDTVFHLGDFGNFDIRTKLAGKIILIEGNYEEKLPFTKRKELEQLFESRGDKYIMKINGHASAEFTYNGGDINAITFRMCHRPDDCIKDRTTVPKTKFNLFGHIHGRQMIKWYGIDVGVDAHHFAPISLDDVLFFRNAIVKGYYDSNVFE
jgi:calcineurin-like phosphoesterase family protein